MLRIEPPMDDRAQRSERSIRSESEVDLKDISFKSGASGLNDDPKKLRAKLKKCKKAVAELELCDDVSVNSEKLEFYYKKIKKYEIQLSNVSMQEEVGLSPKASPKPKAKSKSKLTSPTQTKKLGAKLTSPKQKEKKSKSESKLTSPKQKEKKSKSDKLTSPKQKEKKSKSKSKSPKPTESKPKVPPTITTLNSPELDKIRDIVESLKLLRREKPGTSGEIDSDDIIMICKMSREILLERPMLLEIEAPLKIVGDIHGQFYDLLRIFGHAGYPETGSNKFLFLGDYVDRGRQSIETITLLLAYKILYPDRVHLLRGNHESAKISRMYGFFDECKRRYSVRLWKEFCNVFDCMPICAIVNDAIICMHGGISPELEDPWKQINAIQRPCPLPDEGLMCDLLWSDPDPALNGWEESDRGVSYLFGMDVLDEFLKKNDLDLVVRAHEVVEDGYQFLGDQKIVTIFSAPSYTGEFDNRAAILRVNKDLKCSFRILKPVAKKRGTTRRTSQTYHLGTPKTLFRQAVKKTTLMNKLLHTAKLMHEEKNQSTLEKELMADRKSYRRHSVVPSPLSSKEFDRIDFDDPLTITCEVEDLTRRETSWGDIWDGIYYDHDQLAEFKYAAAEAYYAEQENGSNWLSNLSEEGSNLASEDDQSNWTSNEDKSQWTSDGGGSHWSSDNDNWSLDN